MEPRPIVIGVSGGTGSGKTTVISMILQRVGAERISSLSHDAYYRDRSGLSFEERTKVNFDHPDSLETELLIEHIKVLLKRQAVEIPVYDFTTHSRKTDVIKISPKPVILVDGILIFAEPELRKLFDIKIYVDTDADIRFIRRMKRDVAERGRTWEAVVNQYLLTVRPMHLEFVEPSKRYADIIIPEGGFNTVALDLVIARIQELLSSER